MPNEAKSQALRWLAQRSLSVRELSLKLAGRGFDADTIQELTEDLERLGFLNERRLAEDVVRRALAHHEGPQRVRQRLMARGFEREIISDVMTSLQETADWLTIAEPLGQRYDRDNPRDRARLMRRLTREGFPFRVIRRLVGEEGRDEPNGADDY